MTILDFQDVTHAFAGGTEAVRDIALGVPRGELCVLLGPSGAGKSTLLNTVNGLVLPTMGRVVFDDVPVNRRNLKQVLTRVGMTHQQLHLVPRLSVLDNVLSGLLPVTPTWRAMIKSFPDGQRRQTCRLLEEVELEEKHLYRRASDMSGGQQQRVAIARAFINEPDVVLADEPVASLDPAVSRHVLTLLRRASRQRNTTVLCSLHQVEFAVEFADRIVALRGGRVVFDGAPDALTPPVLQDIYGSDQGDLLSPQAETRAQPAARDLSGGDVAGPGKRNRHDQPGGNGDPDGPRGQALRGLGTASHDHADEIEDADPGPQRALSGTGANRLKVLRFAVFPQVLPQYYAYVQYILERNIRTATVLGIVGAGGIGTELKGRWDLFDYDHVATILLVIFLTVAALELVTQRLRARAI